MNAIGLSNEELEREEEGEVDDPLVREVDLPVFDDERLEEVKERFLYFPNAHNLPVLYMRSKQCSHRYC